MFHAFSPKHFQQLSPLQEEFFGAGVPQWIYSEDRSFQRQMRQQKQRLLAGLRSTVSLLVFRGDELLLALPLLQRGSQGKLFVTPEAFDAQAAVAAVTAAVSRPFANGGVTGAAATTQQLGEGWKKEGGDEEGCARPESADIEMQMLRQPLTPPDAPSSPAPVREEEAKRRSEAAATAAVCTGGCTQVYVDLSLLVDESVLQMPSDSPLSEVYRAFGLTRHKYVGVLSCERSQSAVCCLAVQCLSAAASPECPAVKILVSVLRAL